MGAVKCENWSNMFSYQTLGCLAHNKGYSVIHMLGSGFQRLLHRRHLHREHYFNTKTGAIRYENRFNLLWEMASWVSVLVLL